MLLWGESQRRWVGGTVNAIGCTMYTLLVLLMLRWVRENKLDLRNLVLGRGVARAVSISVAVALLSAALGLGQAGTAALGATTAGTTNAGGRGLPVAGGAA